VGAETEAEAEAETGVEAEAKRGGGGKARTALPSGKEPPYLTSGWVVCPCRIWDGANLVGRFDLAPNATELYDHRGVNITKVPFDSELANNAHSPSYAGALAELQDMLRSAFAPPHAQQVT